MKLTLFFTDGFDWRIKTNRHAFPSHWAEKEPVLVVEYPDFKHWRQPLLKKETKRLSVFRMKKFFPFSRKSFLLEKMNLLINLVILKMFVLPVVKGSVKRIWMFYPTVFPLAKFFWPRKLFVYHLVDELSEYRFWYQTAFRRYRLKRVEAKTIKGVDFVLTTSPVLDKKARRGNKKSFYLGNGAYVNKLLSFSEAKEKVGIKKFKRPICGFIGGIDDYRFDRKLLGFLAESLGQVSFVVIGPVGKSGVVKKENVYYLGYQDKKVVAHYLKEFSVGLMLYPKNSYTQAVFPVKLFEYFAFGLPVVTKNLPFSKKYRELLYVAKNNNQYLALLKKALREKDSGLEKERKKVALAHDWTVVVNSAYNVVK
jgi:glycosyltransferase involved in cell wall biosynthesis